MGIRTYKPTSAGRRNSSVSDFAELTDKNKKPEKSLTEPLQKKGGRNNQGFITARHRGGGHKRMYRIIDFRRNDRDLCDLDIHANLCGHTTAFAAQRRVHWRCCSTDHPGADS